MIDFIVFVILIILMIFIKNWRKSCLFFCLILFLKGSVLINFRGVLLINILFCFFY